MGNITLKDVLKQLKYDLIGKDSYRGITLTYAWMANQFGHFSLGFIPTLLVSAFLSAKNIENVVFKTSLGVMLFWLLFELYNFLGPLLTAKQSKSNILYLPDKKYVFKPDWKNVAFDTTTDLLFFFFGALSCALFLSFEPWAKWATLLVILLLVYPVYYWFTTKMFLQYARFPQQTRLSQWQNDCDCLDTDQIKNFLKNCLASSGNHLLIFGGRKSEKSTLAIGLATELAIKKHACSYYTGSKLYHTFSMPTEEIRQFEKADKWTWCEAACLVIDDINPGGPHLKKFITADELFAYIVHSYPQLNRDNCDTLCCKNMIWVCGDFSVNNNEWHGLLVKLGVPAQKVFVADTSVSSGQDMVFVGK